MPLLEPEPDALRPRAARAPSPGRADAGRALGVADAVTRRYVALIEPERATRPVLWP